MSASRPAMGIDAAVQRIEAACHSPLERIWEELDSTLWEPIRDATASALDAHRGVLAQLGETCPEDPREAVAILRTYLARVQEEVHAPLHKALRDRRLPDAVQRPLSRAGDVSREAASTLARDVPLTFDPACFRGTPGDRVGRSLAKASARMRALVRRPPEVRVVDMRSLARLHRATRLAAGEQAWSLATARRWGGWMADLESVWGEWAEVVFPALTAPPPETREMVDSSDGDRGEGDAETEGAPLWDPWVRVRAAGGKLEAGLAQLMNDCPHAEVMLAAGDDLTRWSEGLRQDVGLAGTSVLPLSDMPEEPPPPAELEAWSRWLVQGVARLAFHSGLMDVILEADAVRRRTIESMADGIVRPLEASAVEASQRLHTLTGDLAGTDRSPGPGLDAARLRADEVVETMASALAGHDAIERLVGRSADSAVADITAAVLRLPDSVKLHGTTRPKEGLTRPTDVVRTIQLQEAGRQAFDALRMERLRTASSVVTTASDRLAGAVAEVGEIFTFGFGAATAEMEGDAPEAKEQSVVLATEGLTRAADAARHLTRPLIAALERADYLLDVELTAGCRRLIDRALAQRMQGQLLDARSQLAARVAAWREGLSEQTARGTRRVRFLWARTRRSGTRLVRWARVMVGAPSTSGGAGARTARRLADADSLRSELPLVYQRLFNPGPVTDPALLVGRDVELEDLEAHWQRWQQEDAVPLLVTGHRGVGISSFFNVFVERARQAGASVVQEDIEDRQTGEAELATRLADMMGLDPRDSLDDLAADILRAPEGAVPELVVVGGLEHLYLRVPGGTDLLERVLTLMAETEPKMFWVASLTSSAWQVIQKTEPTAVAQVDRMELSPLGADATKAAVLARHRRSGVPLRYAEPAEGRRLLRRRLRRARGKEARQSILESDHFETLHRTSHGNLRLTLYRWLRSCDFRSVEGELRIRPLELLDFSYLEELGPTQNFTLKAFMEHGTLTLQEHDAVFRLPRQESYQIFESLQNRRVIQALSEEDDSSPKGSEVTDDLRYCIRPLLTGAVAAHLATRNIVH